MLPNGAQAIMEPQNKSVENDETYWSIVTAFFKFGQEIKTPRVFILACKFVLQSVGYRYSHDHKHILHVLYIEAFSLFVTPTWQVRVTD